MFIFERERECKQGRSRERERGRHRIQSRLQALNCWHRARRGAQTHKPWDHDLSRSRTLNRLSHTGAPAASFFFLMFIYFWEREKYRERACKQRRSRERERGRHRIGSRLQALSCQHRARHGAQTHKRWDHDLSWSRKLNWLSPPGVPV